MPHFEKIINYLINDYTNWVAICLQGIHPAQQDVDDFYDDIQLDQNKADAVGSAAYIIKPAQAKLLIEAAVDIYESLDHFLEHPPGHILVLGQKLKAKFVARNALKKPLK